MKKISIAVFLLLGVVFSCQKENNQATPTTHQYSVSLTELTKAATNIIGSEVVKSITPQKGTQPAARGEAKKIEEIVPVPDQNNPSYYIVNYKGGGWAIIAGDKRVSPVLAYSDDSKFQTSGVIHYGLLKWLSDLHQTITKIKSSTSPSLDPVPTTQMWSQLGVLPPPSGGGGGGTGGDGGGGCTPSSSTVAVGPLLNTQWAQDCGYNGTCPVDPTGPCGRDLTGCVATAMSQVLNYWQRPVNYNWAGMQPNTANIFGLMSDAGTSVGMSYGPQESTASGDAISGALTNTFGYASATYDNFDFSTVASDLYYSRAPLILTAYATENSINSCFLFWCWSSGSYLSNGHCWVADGYQITTTENCNTSNVSQTNMMHMNWGWGGQSNGWYSSTSWTPTGTSFNFQYLQKMVHGIHP